jgi:hypothetical protein
MVAEWKHLVADDLAGFMTLAGDEQDVAAAQLRDRGADRLAAVADLNRAGRGPQYSGTDRGRLLAARIVVGDDDAIGFFGGRLPGSRSPPAPNTTTSRPVA